MIHKLPRRIPPLSMIWEDIGKPHPTVLADALGVNVRTVRRWLATDDAPRPVLLALYWISQWGESEVDTRLFNRAQIFKGLSDSLSRENTTLRRDLDATEKALAASRAHSNGRVLAFRQPSHQRLQPRQPAFIEHRPGQQTQRPGLVQEGPDLGAHSARPSGASTATTPARAATA